MASAAADHAAFLRRTMVKSAPTKVDIGVVVKPVYRETGSCFESTVYKGGVRPGAHPDLPAHVEGEEDAFSIHVTTHRPHPASKKPSPRTTKVATTIALCRRSANSKTASLM